MKSKAFWESKLQRQLWILTQLNKDTAQYPGPMPAGLDGTDRENWNIKHNLAARKDRKRQRAMRIVAYCRERIEAIKSRTWCDVLDRGIGV